MNVTAWVGLMLGLTLLATAIRVYDAWFIISNVYGALLVVGGVLASTLIGHPLARVRSALKNLFAVFFPPTFPAEEEAIAELLRFARLAQSAGGLFALANENRDFADGFLHRAVLAAIATGQPDDARRIMEEEIRTMRRSMQEDVNLLRTMATLAPMFGLVGTLLGMMRLLLNLSAADLRQMGPTMALALSSAFFGLILCNLICLPAAGQIRLRALQRAIVLEILLEGVVDIAAGRPAQMIALRLNNFLEERASETPPARARPREATS